MGWKRHLVVLESPWDDGLESTLSVGPFFRGLAGMLNGVDVKYQQFNSKEDLSYYLDKFRRFSASCPRTAYCYIATHGTAGRVQALLRDVNSRTIAKASRGCRGRGFFFGACSFGNRRTATTFLRETGASFVAGYERDIEWAEAMIIDLIFLIYLLSGRLTRTRGQSGELELTKDRAGHPTARGSRDALKVGKWVYEDFPLARALGFVVYKASGRGRAWAVRSSLDG